MATVSSVHRVSAARSITGTVVVVSHRNASRCKLPYAVSHCGLTRFRNASALRTLVTISIVTGACAVRIDRRVYYMCIVTFSLVNEEHDT